VATLNPPTRLRAFWLKLVSHFSLMLLDDRCTGSHVFTIPTTLPSPGLWLPGEQVPRGSRPARCACLCTLSGPLFIQAPRFTRWYEWSSINDDEDNFRKRLRVAAT